MIKIQPSQTADTRTCDFAHVSKATLLASSAQHIGDVGQALAYFGQQITAAAVRHDTEQVTHYTEDGYRVRAVIGLPARNYLPAADCPLCGAPSDPGAMR